MNNKLEIESMPLQDLGNAYELIEDIVINISRQLFNFDDVECEEYKSMEVDLNKYKMILEDLVSEYERRKKNK